MPNPNAIVARVVGLPDAADAAEGPMDQRRPIDFAGDRHATLPPGRRAAAWHGLLDHSRQFGVPAYVEVDPESSVITRVLIPTRATVLELEPSADGDVTVRMLESHAGHVLLRSNTDFPEFLNALEAARSSGGPVLVTSTRDDHEIIDVRQAPPPSETGPPDEDPPPSVVTEAQAAQLFNQMAATTCDPLSIPPGCIPFVFPDDGCYARAHEMVRLMRLQNVEAEKIWIYASSDTNLKPATVNHPNCGVAWWYHVAPTLQVQTASGVEKRVIDPSLMTGPATADAWRQRQSDPAATFEYTDAIPFWPKPYTTPDANYALTNQYLSEKRGYLADRVADYGPPPYACPVVKQAHFILDRSTFGEDEVTAMLQVANPAVIESAIYVVLDGFSPQEIGVTASTPTDPPTIKPTLNVNPAVAQMDILAAHLDFEDPNHLKRRQRITWTYDVRFTGTNGFNFGPATQSVSLSASMSGQSAAASLLLIKQPNPYEIDGTVAWLSTDLRVFQINAGQPKFNATMGATGGSGPDVHPAGHRQPELGEHRRPDVRQCPLDRPVDLAARTVRGGLRDEGLQLRRRPRPLHRDDPGPGRAGVLPAVSRVDDLAGVRPVDHLPARRPGWRHGAPARAQREPARHDPMLRIAARRLGDDDADGPGGRAECRHAGREQHGAPGVLRRLA